MSFYDIAMSPIEFSFLKRMRKKIISRAKGDVLEIGFGTGANVDLYKRQNIKSLSAIDIKLSDDVIQKFQNKLNLIQASAEALPFPDNSFDTVITTIALCSVENLEKSIREIKRVLKPEGIYLFIEHVLPENRLLAKFFNKANKSWSKHMGGCNINRKTVDALKEHGFEIDNDHKKNMKIFLYGNAINKK